MGVEYDGILGSDHLQGVARVCEAVRRLPAANRSGPVDALLPFPRARAHATCPHTRRADLFSSHKYRCAGGDVAAQVGQYVVPNRGCPPEVEEDAMGMAGRITRVIRSDGTVETDGKEQTDAEESCASAERVDRTAGDGREIVFVRWAAVGVERGRPDTRSSLPALLAVMTKRTGRHGRALASSASLL